MGSAEYLPFGINFLDVLQNSPANVCRKFIDLLLGAESEAQVDLLL